jgi:hypothetical protein
MAPMGEKEKNRGKRLKERGLVPGGRGDTDLMDGDSDGPFYAVRISWESIP